MINGKRQRWFFVMLIGIALSFPGIIPHAEAQEAAPPAAPAVTPAEAAPAAQQATPGETKKEQPGTAQKKAKKKARVPRKPLDTGGRGRFGISLLLGIGVKNHDLGDTSDGDVTLSGGGGAGFALIGGYGLSSKWDIEVSAGSQVSELTPEVSNADGEFNRDILRATLFYKMPFTRVTQWKIGAGIGAYLGGEWDLDFSNVPPFGTHDIIQYDDALGFHVAGAFEVVVKDSVYFTAGIQYYYVSYEANSFTVNGAPTSVTSLYDEFRNLNGSGFDLMLSMGKYF